MNGHGIVAPEEAAVVSPEVCEGRRHGAVEFQPHHAVSTKHVLLLEGYLFMLILFLLRFIKKRKSMHSFDEMESVKGCYVSCKKKNTHSYDHVKRVVCCWWRGKRSTGCCRDRCKRRLPNKRFCFDSRLAWSIKHTDKRLPHECSRRQQNAPKLLRLRGGAVSHVFVVVP